MPKKQIPVEVNSFVGGLISDASPLTFPENASLNEDNFVLNSDGSRQRRLGMDFLSSERVSSAAVLTNPTPSEHTSYTWDNAGGDPDKSLLCVQFGNEVRFFDLDVENIVNGFISSHTFNVSTVSQEYSYATVDGILVIASGEKEITIFEYNGTLGTISNYTDKLLIRDLFGVEDVLDDGTDLKDSNNISTRPSSTVLTDELQGHLYNLRNQTWADRRIPGNVDSFGVKDPIQEFIDKSGGKWPSNSDAVTNSLYPDSADGDDRISERFFAKDLISNPIGNSQAPIGHYIIDALDRGQSRQEALQQSLELADNDSAYLQATIQKDDITPGGATVVAQYSGRVWYMGFSGEVTDGDSKSPRMSSYLLFSRQVEGVSDINKCYQDGDPTSFDNPDIVDTDGGFIRLDEAYGIKSAKVLDTSLFIMAENGVWRVEGDDGNTFRASGYSVIKVSDRGIRSASSAVVVENSLVYWGDDGIYSVERNQFGDWISNSLTEDKLQSFYSEIDADNIENAKGFYDSYDRKVRWIYYSGLDSEESVKELILDKVLGSFYTNTIGTLDNTYPKVVSIFETNPYRVRLSDANVVVGADNVVVGTDQVTSQFSSRTSDIREVAYVTISSVGTTIEYGFSTYNQDEFRDWKSVDSVGVDAPAFLITGFLSGGDFQRQKQITYLTAYFRKTETGYIVNGSGDLVPVNESSCLVTPIWDWTDDPSSNRWGRSYEYYRHRRLYLPVDVNDGYDDGETVVTSRNKLRGKGRVLSIKWETSPDKDCHLHGWSLIIGVLTNV